MVALHAINMEVDSFGCHILGIFQIVSIAEASGQIWEIYAVGAIFSWL